MRRQGPADRRQRAVAGRRRGDPINGQRLTSLSAIRFAGDGDPGRLPPAHPALRRSARSATRSDCRPTSPTARAALPSQPCRTTTASGSTSTRRRARPSLPACHAADRAQPAAGAPAATVPAATGTPSPTTPRTEELPVIAALGLLVGIVAGLLLQPDRAAVAAALPADRRHRRARRGLRRASGPCSTASSTTRSSSSRSCPTSSSRRSSSSSATSSASARQLSTGVVVVLGVRIFSNVASIRRHLFKA